MHRIRVLVAPAPGVLRDIVAGLLSAEDDIEFSEAPDHDELSVAMRRVQPDVVIISCTEDDLVPMGRRLFQADPAVKVIAMTDDGRLAFLHELRPHTIALGEVSPDDLLGAIRQAVGVNAAT